MFAEIYGPTQLDMKHKLNTDFKSISFALSGRSVGQLPGSIIGGFLADRFSGYCHLMVAVVLDVAAGITIAVPWSPNITFMWIYCFLLGCVDSTINIGLLSNSGLKDRCFRNKMSFATLVLYPVYLTHCSKKVSLMKESML